MTSVNKQAVSRSALAKDVALMRDISVRSLDRMYLPDEQMFVHCIRRGADGDKPEGVSRRYTAITLLGLAGESEEIAAAAMKGHDCETVCQRLLADVSEVSNMGDVALTLWVARLLNHKYADRALDCLRKHDPVHGDHPTVEVAWALTALSVKSDLQGDDGMRDAIASRLSASQMSSGVFPHWPVDAPQSTLRGHVACFADLVYPTQAFSHHYIATGDEQSAEAARRCGAFMCETQGSDGQWWWHFDSRTGKIVESFPVYSVHQDSMAPMALFDLQDACGVDSGDAIARGLAWLRTSPEIGGESLIDTGADLIWRKIARHEPGKASRGVQAIASRVHPSFRVPGIDTVFKPGRIDFETRPYHMGWIFHAWTPQRLQRWGCG